MLSCCQTAQTTPKNLSSLCTTSADPSTSLHVHGVPHKQHYLEWCTKSDSPHRLDGDRGLPRGWRRPRGRGRQRDHPSAVSHLRHRHQFPPAACAHPYLLHFRVPRPFPHQRAQIQPPGRYTLLPCPSICSDPCFNLLSPTYCDLFFKTRTIGSLHPVAERRSAITEV